jgi:2-desacetyl-2-hydroxyethyl bacteriochlorophyllide A dehydrogenase
MKGLWLSSNRLSVRDDLELTPLADHELRVRVLRAGICGTDLALAQGLYAFDGIPGHEFVGLVEEGPSHLAGRRVVGEINAACGNCPECRAGLRKHCRARTALGIRGRAGAFAQYLDLPVENLHVVPDCVSTDAAVFTEPLAAALDIVERLAPPVDEPVLVVGAGRLGQLVCRVLAASGVPVVAVGRNADKLARLQGAALSTRRSDEVEPRSFAMAVECTGNAAGLPIALGALKAQGVLVLKSTYPRPVELDTESLVVDELRLVGSRCGPFDRALRLLEERRVEVESLIDARFPLSEGAEAFACSRQPEILKVVLDIGSMD